MGDAVIGGELLSPFIVFKQILLPPFLSALAGILATLFLSVTASLAAPPDLTAGGTIPSNLTTT